MTTTRQSKQSFTGPESLPTSRSFGSGLVLLNCKRCTKCKQEKHLSLFSPDKRHSDGRASHCRKCKLVAILKYQRTDRARQLRRRTSTEERKKRPEKVAAHRAVLFAVKDGILPKVTGLLCKCGDRAKHYHHHSYAKECQLCVEPLCAKCHKQLHLLTHTTPPGSHWQLLPSPVASIIERIT